MLLWRREALEGGEKLNAVQGHQTPALSLTNYMALTHWVVSGTSEPWFTRLKSEDNVVPTAQIAGNLESDDCAGLSIL